MDADAVHLAQIAPGDPVKINAWHVHGGGDFKDVALTGHLGHQHW